MRPAGYEHIPEINATGAEIIAIISLVVGLASTALSFFLQPKPVGEQPKAGSRTLSSRSGADRFAQTTGFDSSAELAQYGEPVPIIWTRWTGTTGGVLISPKLVWSRMFSLGNQQGVKLLFVVGEQGIGAPDLAGIYLGNNGLNVHPSTNFALWWRGDGKVSRSNLLYGSQGSEAGGDPQTTDALFFTQAGAESFSHTLSPSNSTQFGVSNGVPNGTQYRLNYRIISIPDAADGKPGLRRERAKICGRRGSGNDLSWPQGGIGFGYFRRQGIAGFSSKTSFNASVGQTIRYIISGNRLANYYWGGGRDSKYGGGRMDDVNNTLDSECTATDEVMQVGETFLINGSAWRVIDRSIPSWLPGLTQNITLQCVEVFGNSEVRVLSSAQLVSEAGNSPGLPEQIDPNVNAGSAYDNPSKLSIAAIKNTRPCDITQIGLRSQVWGRFNGLCNFNSLYSEKQLKELDSQNVSVQSGTMSDYFTRTSAFTIYYREIGQSEWTRTGLRFCIRGSAPVDQFHSIAIRHGTRRALEFRFVPISGATLTRLGDSTQIYWINSSVANSELSGNGITVRVPVESITIGQCATLKTMQVDDDDGPVRVFDENTGIAEISQYGGLITRSCDSGPEHQIAYVNEQFSYSTAPSFQSLTTVAFAARSSRSLNNFDQLRVWIGSGVNNSNSFPDLVLYLLQRTNGVNSQLIDQASFTRAASFCASRGLFFDGVIADRVNLRQYIADTAPFFLLNFVIANGKFALMPAIPDGSPTISNIFTSGNIIEGSFTVEYLPADQRRDFQALVTYRRHLRKNEIPVLKTCRVRFSDVPTSAPVESFDISQFCTNRDHAIAVARYFLSLRRRVTHVIKFKIAPEGAGVAPGSYIKVALEQVVTDTYGNGVISSVNGQVTSATPLADGTYAITYYQPGVEGLQSGNLTVTNGIAANTQIWGALFTLTSSNISTGTYLVEQIDLDDDGLVNVTATEYPASAISSDMTGSGMILEET